MGAIADCCHAAVNDKPLPQNAALFWMVEYFNRNRMKKLGFTQPLSEVDDYERKVLLWIDIQFDIKTAEKAKRDSKRRKMKDA
jgi:hypothetical protein